MTEGTSAGHSQKPVGTKAQPGSRPGRHRLSLGWACSQIWSCPKQPAKVLPSEPTEPSPHSSLGHKETGPSFLPADTHYVWCYREGRKVEFWFTASLFLLPATHNEHIDKFGSPYICSCFLVWFHSYTLLQALCVHQGRLMTNFRTDSFTVDIYI